MLHKIYNRLLNGFVAALETSDTPTEKDAFKPVTHPCIFIIGAPRSGSTLLYQCITEYFDAAYIQNIHRTFYTNPAFAQRWIVPFLKKPKTRFQSQHGQTQGLTAPSECAVYWYRFFRRKPQYIPAAQTDQDGVKRLAFSLNRLCSQLKGKPLFVKNMNHALRLPSLLNAVPNALFIVTHRNERDTAISILNARKSIHGDYAAWWSMEPDTINEISSLPTDQQTVRQVKDIYNLIDQTRNDIGNSHFLDISHDDLTKNPQNVMHTIEKFLSEHTIKLLRSGASLPATFETKQPKLDDPDLEAQVERAANGL